MKRTSHACPARVAGVSITEDGVKHRTYSHAPVNASPEKVPYRSFDPVEGHCTISLITKKKNARVVITVLATADQIMIL